MDLKAFKTLAEIYFKARIHEEFSLLKICLFSLYSATEFK